MRHSVKLGQPHKEWGFRFSVGFHLNGGKRTQSVFWLGHNKSLAEKLGEKIFYLYQLDSGVSAGKKVWSEQGHAAAKQMIRLARFPAPVLGSISPALGFPIPNAPALTAPATAKPIFAPVVPTPAAPAPQAPPTPAASPAPASIMLHAALDEFLESEKTRRDGNDISDENYQGYYDRVTLAKRLLDDRPLNTIDTEGLEKIRHTFTVRPISPIKKTKLSVATVSNALRALSRFFEWAAHRHYWTPIMDWRPTLALNGSQKKKLKTREEEVQELKAKREHNSKPMFTIDELRILYYLGTPLQRSLLLMGVSLAWTIKPIGTCRKDDLVEQDDGLYVHRLRGKTKVEGYWWVMPELAAMMRYYVNETPKHPDNLLLLTSGNKPYYYWVNNKVESISDEWNALLDVAASQQVSGKAM